MILEDSKQPEGDDDYLGSVEPSFPSPQFVHNFTYALTELYKPGTLFNLFPSTPYGAVMPSEAKFLGKFQYCKLERRRLIMYAAICVLLYSYYMRNVNSCLRPIHLYILRGCMSLLDS